MSKVRKIDFFALYTGFVKSDLADFSSFPSLLLMALLLLILVASRALAGWELIFNIEISGAAILLKP